MEIYEDIYESLSEEHFKIIEKINDNNKLIIIKKENDIKLNKLKLLMYQKLINILFSVISINIRKNVKTFFEYCKFFKIKSLGYKLDSEKYKYPEFYKQNLIKQLQREDKKKKIKE